MKMGIIGAGSIARVMAETIRRMDDVECTAIASRNISKAQAFAKEHGFGKAYGSYDELLADPDVQLVYIALPHSHHCRWTKNHSMPVSMSCVRKLSQLMKLKPDR